MIPQIVSDASLVALLGGGEVNRADLAAARGLGAIVVAADSGADRALDLGSEPALVIGDMDSISPKAEAALSDRQILHVGEQDSTDFEKCLQRLPQVETWALGFLGGRLDH